MKQEIDKAKKAIEWFYRVMERGNIRNDEGQEVYETAIDALNQQIREYEQRSEHNKGITLAQLSRIVSNMVD